MIFLQVFNVFFTVVILYRSHLCCTLKEFISVSMSGVYSLDDAIAMLSMVLRSEGSLSKKVRIEFLTTEEDGSSSRRRRGDAPPPSTATPTPTAVPRAGGGGGAPTSPWNSPIRSASPKPLYDDRAGRSSFTNVSCTSTAMLSGARVVAPAHSLDVVGGGRHADVSLLRDQEAIEELERRWRELDSSPRARRASARRAATRDGAAATATATTTTTPTPPLSSSTTTSSKGYNELSSAHWVSSTKVKRDVHGLMATPPRRVTSPPPPPSATSPRSSRLPLSPTTQGGAPSPSLSPPPQPHPLTHAERKGKGKGGAELILSSTTTMTSTAVGSTSTPLPAKSGSSPPRSTPASTTPITMFAYQMDADSARPPYVSPDRPRTPSIYERALKHPLLLTKPVHGSSSQQYSSSSSVVAARGALPTPRSRVVVDPTVGLQSPPPLQHPSY